MTCEKTPGFLTRLLSRLHPEDPQAAVQLSSTAVLLASLAWLVRAIAHRLEAGNSIDWGTVCVFFLALAAVCTLARIKAPDFPFSGVGVAAPPVTSGLRVCVGTTPNPKTWDEASTGDDQIKVGGTE